MPEGAERTTKDSIRRLALMRRDALTEEERAHRDRRIRERLLGSPHWLEARCLLLYLSFGSETDTWRVLAEALRAGKRVYCPRITDPGRREMDFFRVRDAGELRSGRYGITEPLAAEAFSPELSGGEGVLCLLPGVAFGEAGGRVGYGGGYYDRYLAAHPVAERVAIGYELQVVPCLEESAVLEETDLRYTSLLTESRWIDTRAIG